MAFRFAVLAALLVPAASLTLIKGTSELKQFGQVTMGSELHPEQTARLLASVQDTWRTEAARSDVESLTSFPKSCSTVASAALMGSSGDHDRVQEYMANVCKQPVLDMWHQTTCNKFKVSLGKSMMFNTFANRMNFNYGKFCSGFWKDFSAEETVSRAKLAQLAAAAKQIAEQKHKKDEEKMKLEFAKELAQQAENKAQQAAAAKQIAEEKLKKDEEHKSEEEAKAFMEKKKKEQAVKPNPLLEGAMKMEGAMAKTAQKAQEPADKAITHITKEAASVVDNLKLKKDLKEANARSVALRKEKAVKAIAKAAEEAIQQKNIVEEEKTEITAKQAALKKLELKKKEEAEKAEKAAKAEKAQKAEKAKLAVEKAEKADVEKKAELKVEETAKATFHRQQAAIKTEQIKELEAKLKIVEEKKRARQLAEAEAKKEQIKVLEAKLKIALEKKRVRQLAAAKQAEAAKVAKDAADQKKLDAEMALEQAEKAKRVAKAESESKVEAAKAAASAKTVAFEKALLKKNIEALEKAESKMAAEKVEKAADAEADKKHQAAKVEHDALIAKAREAAKLALLKK